MREEVGRDKWGKKCRGGGGRDNERKERRRRENKECRKGTGEE